MYTTLYEARFYSFERKDGYEVSIQKDCIGYYYLFYMKAPAVSFGKNLQKIITAFLLWEELSQCRGYEKVSSIAQINQCSIEESYEINRRII